MNRVRVKICGIRSLEEAIAAVEAGADGLGFNFWPSSPRFITADAAREVIAAVSPFVACIGVFVNEDPQQILKTAADVRLTAVQLHGDESPDFCGKLEAVKIIKAVRVGPEFDPAVIRGYPVSAILLDAKTRESYGGTGQRFDWRFAIQSKQYAPVILAGGLTEANVTEAIEEVRPAAIDVCSGIEAAPGRKDLEKLRRFMARVGQANASITEWVV